MKKKTYIIERNLHLHTEYFNGQNKNNQPGTTRYLINALHFSSKYLATLALRSIREDLNTKTPAVKWEIKKITLQSNKLFTQLSMNF